MIQIKKSYERAQNAAYRCKYVKLCPLALKFSDTLNPFSAQHGFFTITYKRKNTELMLYYHFLGS